MEIPIFLLRNVRIVSYLEDILLMSKSQKEILEALGSLVLLLQQLGFVINNEKSQFQPVQEIEVLGLVVNSI